MKKDKNIGFTLIEIMIVLAIMMIIGVIIIPSMIRSRVNANESAAIVACKTIANACNLYFNDNSIYPNQLNDMMSLNPPYVDPKYGTATDEDSAINGYYYSYIRPSTDTFELRARSKGVFFGSRCFFVDRSSVVRACNGHDCEPSDTDEPVG
jgi:type II secretory pathway pseudopilin PulG